MAEATTAGSALHGRLRAAGSVWVATWLGLASLLSGGMVRAEVLPPSFVSSYFSDPSVRVVVVEFWSQSCGPCKRGLKPLSQLEPVWREEGVRLVMVQVPMSAAETCGSLEDELNRQGLAWYPATQTCDFEVAKRLTGGLPQAHVYSWRGGAPMVANTLGDTKRWVDALLDREPKILLCKGLASRGARLGKDTQCGELQMDREPWWRYFDQAVSRSKRVALVSDPSTVEALSREQAATDNPLYRCPPDSRVGQALQPNLFVDLVAHDGGPQELELVVVEAGTKCRRSFTQSGRVRAVSTAHKLFDQLYEDLREPYAATRASTVGDAEKLAAAAREAALRDRREREEAERAAAEREAQARAEREARLRARAELAERMKSKGYVQVESAGRSFEMSSAPVDDDEIPHRVEFTRSFWLNSTEVTQAEWGKFVKWWNDKNDKQGKSGAMNPSYFKSCGSNCPVESVNWYEAALYCNYLSTLDELEECYELSESNGAAPGRKLTFGQVKFKGLDCKGYRLPTEAEWEYAARSGEERGAYPTSTEELGRIAVYSTTGTKKVKSKAPNAWGLYDMIGNVWEWVHDAYQKDLSTLPPGDPVVKTGPARVVRGCSWFSSARYCRAAYRFWYSPGLRFVSVGFRPARSVP